MTTTHQDRPDFIIIGAMKCATSTLHDQLAAQSDIFMSTPKEPNFFSDDEIYKKGIDWYSGLFEGTTAKLKGESSTHYTKLPTHPNTIKRMQEHGLKDTKFIYVIREPIQRLVSHYIHEWSMGVLKTDINDAIRSHPELIDYSRYNDQISAYLAHYSPDQILVVFYESLISRPDSELERICQFIGYEGTPSWDHARKPQNVSSQRIRQFPLYSLLIESQLMATLRRTLIPTSIREKVKGRLVMKSRPELNPAVRKELEDTFDKDLRALGKKLNLDLNIDNYSQTAKTTFPELAKEKAESSTSSIANTV